MINIKAQLNLFDPIFVDCFAGGGGWSTGAELALGRPIDIAVNHNPDAILMHKTNHPHTHHYCEDIYAVSPKKAVNGRYVAWAHFSPDCRHHSKAKGGKPVEKKIRGLAWVVLRWAAEVRPNIISLENVEEFLTWGPVRKGRPRKSKAGKTFIQWKRQLESLGYTVEYKILTASDYGTPTIRKRLFILARCDGNPIVWPKATHGNPKSEAVQSGELLPWRTAADIIDWSLPVPSIFADKSEIKRDYGINAKRPLMDNTLRRIIRGVDKFVIKADDPYIIPCNKNGDICAPNITVVNHSGEFRGQEIEKPLHTITGKHGYGLSSPLLKPFVIANNENAAGSSINAPVGKITTGGHQILAAPVLTEINQISDSNDQYRNTEDTVQPTVPQDETCITAPTLIQYHSEQPNEYMRGQNITDPLFTVDAANRYGYVASCLIQYHGTSEEKGLNEPLATTLSRNHDALIVPHISKYYSGGYTGTGVDMESPVPTVTTVDHNSLAAAHVIKMKGDNLGQDTREPMQTVTASGLHFGTVATTVVQAQPGMNLYNWSKIRDLLNKYCGYTLKDDEILLIAIKDEWYIITDIGLRMLSPRELFAANGFPSDYIIDKDYLGNEYAKTKQVARCGNAVPPPFATAIVRANAPEYCGRNISTMRELNEVIAV